jgi:uncharacterized membrane protein YphA (DoxX/SURF4 family)
MFLSQVLTPGEWALWAQAIAQAGAAAAIAIGVVAWLFSGCSCEDK